MTGLPVGIAAAVYVPRHVEQVLRRKGEAGERPILRARQEGVAVAAEGAQRIVADRPRAALLRIIHGSVLCFECGNLRASKAGSWASCKTNTATDRKSTRLNSSH